MTEPEVTSESNETTEVESWDGLREALESDNSDRIERFLDSLSGAEKGRALSHLSLEEQTAILTHIDPADAAAVLHFMPEIQAAALLDELTAEQAAPIIEEMASNEQADMLAAMDQQGATAILGALDQKSATSIRELMTYPADTAGGLMVREYVAFRHNLDVAKLLENLKAKGDSYSDFEIQYIFVVDEYRRLKGVLPLRDILFAKRTHMLKDIMIPEPISVKVDATLNELAELFDERQFLGVPVVDREGRIVGVVRRISVRKAVEQRTSRLLMKISGIIGGEELRSLPMLTRSSRRLSWLSLNILLNIVAASVIAIYQNTLEQVIALAVFLPIISDMSGCSGNQSVAVSMRELTLGLIKPRDYFRVWLKEAPLGLLNGLVLGTLLGLAGGFWQQNATFGLVVGLALAANTLLSVCMGGLIPLALRKLKLDPALVSGPILTTCTDMCGFFFVLSFASIAMSKLV